jgi:hypothetical protein
MKGAMHSKTSALTLVVDCWLSAGSKRCPSRGTCRRGKWGGGGGGGGAARGGKVTIII